MSHRTCIDRGTLGPPRETLFEPTAPDVVELVLPYPPTVNTYWRVRIAKKKGGGQYVQVYISEEGKAFTVDLQEIALRRGVKTLRGHVRLEAVFNPPDERRRDLGNLDKALGDALTKAGILEDDSQIREQEFRFGPKVEGGRATIKIITLGP